MRSPGWRFYKDRLPALADLPLEWDAAEDAAHQPTVPKAMTGTGTVVRFRRDLICRAMAPTTRAEK